MKPMNKLSDQHQLDHSRPASGSVYVIDDDAAGRDHLRRLFHDAGHDVHTFASLRDYCRHERRDESACLVMDFHLSCAYRLEQSSRRAHLFGDGPPVVFTAAQADVASGVRAIKQGAIDFLMKPLDDAEMLAAVRRGLREDLALRAAEARKADIRKHYGSLTPRERQVVAHVARGRLSKQIAGDLGLSVNTIKMYRSHAMRRMQAESRADLVRLLEAIGHAPDPDAAPRPQPGSSAPKMGRHSLGIKPGGYVQPEWSLLTGHGRD